MKPVQGGHSLATTSFLHMGISTQIMVLVCLLTSTAFITRMIVLGNIDADSFTSPEFQRLGRDANCAEAPGSVPFTSLRYSTSSYQDGEADPAKYMAYQDALDTTFELHGYILSAVKSRYEYASSVLQKFNIIPHHYVPYSYKSQLVYDEMESYNNSTMFHGDPHNLKMFSHRMAHTGMLYDFVNDHTAKMNSWRFFFEDDIEIHPNVSAAEARASLAKGLELGSGDGILYLGICGPGKVTEPPESLTPGIFARRTHGTCTHAYGVTKWRAQGMLSHIDKVKLRVPPGSKDPRKGYMFYDFVTRAYGETVTKAWILGMNLKSPVPDVNHWGLVYQDRLKYPSFISPKREVSGPH